MIAQIPAIAWAQESADPMEACFRIAEPDVRFACYDREMQRRHAVVAPKLGVASLPAANAAPAAAAPGATSANAATKRPVDDTIGLDGRQLSLKRKAEGLQPQPVQSIVAALATLTVRPGHLYYFQLDNGQVWESTDGEPALLLAPHETVVIRPGILGAFFLKTAEGNSIRVHRVH